MNIIILDLDDNCKGPNFTYFVQGVGCSYIDHILISNSIKHLVKGCEVIHDNVKNTSEHLPLMFSLKCDLLSMPNDSYVIHTPSVIFSWHKMNNEQISSNYTAVVAR